MRVLVTGAAGFIGSWVAQRLLVRGDTVVGLDNFDPYYDRAVKQQNLRAIGQPDAFDFHEADINDVDTLDRLLPQVDRVVHLAALAGVRPSIAQPARYMRVNVEGTVALLESCQRANVRHLVVASSSSVYGERSQTPFDEQDPCGHPASPYAASKRAVELVCSAHHDLHGLGITCLRYFTVYGPRQRPEMAIHRFVRHASRGQSIPMFGDGSSGRDYTYIDDIVDGTIAALDRQDGRFAVYNLGGAHPVLLKDLISAIAETMGHELPIEHHPWQAGDVSLTSAAIHRAERDLDFKPQVPLHEGLARFVSWYREKDTD